MSWAEVSKINSNIKKPLNEQIQNIKCLPIRLITASTSFIPEKTGIYKVICVGAGADGYGSTGSSSSYVGFNAGGGSGGVAVKVLHLESGIGYNVTVSTTASFGNIVTATGGTAGKYSSSNGQTNPTGGTATGGDYNFKGTAGEYDFGNSGTFEGGSVGVWFTELAPIGDRTTNGDGVLRYGGGGHISRSTYSSSSPKSGQPAAVIIIPLEMEE